MDGSVDSYDSFLERKLDKIMPWIGLYITAASVVCTLAMAADAVNGFRCKKLWFPCKYFSLNALFLMLLAVAMKIPQDVDTNLQRNYDTHLPKISSLIFMSTAMANFMSSLGSMNNKELLANIIALGILVITIVVNVLIQLFQLDNVIIGILLLTISMLLLLPALVASAISVPTIKKDLELKYHEKHKVALMAEEVMQRRETIRIDNQREVMMKYWVMAETSSPQFVMARSVVCATSTLIPLLPAIAIAIVFIVEIVMYKDEVFRLTSSVYGEYTRWILVIQIIGVVVGLIAPTFRWFLAVGFKCSTTNIHNLRKEFKIETHWIQTLVDLRDSFSALQIRQDTCSTRYLHDLKWFILTFCIGVQIMIILFSKLLAFVPVLLIRPFLLCFAHSKKFIMKMINHENVQSGDDTELINLSPYVLLLEGEAELPRRILKSICRRADNMIQTGRKKQPKCLLNLLHKFNSFIGVAQFDTNQIPSLHSHEPPNCWTLPVVTLTSIAIALPNITKDKREKLVTSVSEGLSLVKIVQNTSYTNDEILNIIKAADVSWVRVAFYKKWLDMDLSKTSLKCKTSKEVLQELSNKAKSTVLEFKREMIDPLKQNPLNWPIKVLAANSMYRISRTILLSYESKYDQTEEGLFEGISVMIADILAACLTNLPHVITTMCHHSAIEKREESVHEAFLLLGKTEQILELLHQQEYWPSLDHDKASYIDEWRAIFQQDIV